MSNDLNVLYEDNHIIIVSMTCHDIVQGDKTGDVTLADKVKAYIKEKYAKPGAVFCGVTHRLDRPTSAEHKVKKTYWAVTEHTPKPESGELRHWLKRIERLNKTVVTEKKPRTAKKPY